MPLCGAFHHPPFPTLNMDTAVGHIFQLIVVCRLSLKPPIFKHSKILRDTPTIARMAKEW